LVVAAQNLSVCSLEDNLSKITLKSLENAISIRRTASV
jgi:hypothetical protein